MNDHLAPEIEVVCLMTSSRHSFISSSLIREVASLGGDVDGLVPAHVREALQVRFGSAGGDGAVPGGGRHGGGRAAGDG